MGFRFYRRVKLGKRLGLNISKSGISPSIRTKRGAISAKGFSIRTGIKGLSYRKYFSNKEARGCLGFVLIVFSIVTILKSKK